MKITIYSTPSCKYCVLAKEYFKEQGLDFIEKDCSIADNKRELMLLTDRVSVPTIRIDNQVFIGFQKEKISSIISNKWEKATSQ